MFERMKHRKLYRSPQDGIAFGICSGLGRYLQIDPVFIRVLFIVGAVLTKAWLFGATYIVLIFLVPLDPAQDTVDQHQTPKDVTEE